MSETGKLYVFEGPDGIGKSTLAKALVQHLQTSGVDCEYMSFPGRDEGTLGHLVYQLHHRHKELGIKSIDPASVQMLHIAAHVDAIKRCILPSLDKGKIIVLDRFWWSTWVYGLANGVDRTSLKLMLNLENCEWSGVVPTAAFLIARKNPIRKEYSKERWNILREHYGELAESMKVRHPVWIIDNNKSEKNAFNSILKAIDHTSNNPTKPIQHGFEFPTFPEEKVKKN